MDARKQEEELARSLGARDYIDSAADDPAATLLAMGGAKAIIATVTNAEAMQRMVAAPPRRHDDDDRRGWADHDQSTGTPRQARGRPRLVFGDGRATSEDTLAFSQLNDIVSMNEIYPFDEAHAAYDRMMSGKARFRVVLKID